MWFAVFESNCKASRRRAKAFIALVVAVMLVVAGSFSQAWGYFNFGTVNVSLGAASVSVQAGSSTSISVSASPWSDDQTLGCGAAGCPQTCTVPGSYDGSCFDANGQCKCAGYDYSTYYTTLSASSSNSGVASAYVDGGTLYVTGNAPGVATITVTGQLRQWTSGSSSMTVNVTAPPQTTTPSTPSGDTQGSSDSGASAPSQSTSGSTNAAPSVTEIVNAAGVPQEAVASESTPDKLNETVTETTAGKFYTVELNSHCSVAEELGKIVGTSDHMTFWYGNTSDQPEYSWMFNGEDLSEGENLDLDLSIITSKLGTGDVANIMEQADDGVVLDFGYDGELPAPAEIFVDVSALYADGTVLSLYCYDETTHEFAKEQDGVEVALKYASFTIDHCSTWALSTDDLTAYQVEQVNTPLAAAVSDESPQSVAESAVNPGLVAGVIAAAVVVVAVVVAVIVRRRRGNGASEEEADPDRDDVKDEAIAEGSDEAGSL